MDAKKISLKVATAGGLAPSHARAIEAFHQVIAGAKLPEPLVDVVDYSHVHRGPSALLVGHESDYGLELGPGGARLFYQRKRVVDDAADSRLHDALRRLLAMAALLERELAPLRFALDDIELRFLDRLTAPNSEATFSTYKPEIAKWAETLLGSGASLERTSLDEREPLTVRVRAVDSAAPSVAEARARLGFA
ncbi:MAG: hypothetical protein U0271_30090 [Polyangiaceae bacterium]